VGTVLGRIPYSSLLLLEAGMSTDWSSQLERLWDAMATAVLNVYDAYGWVIPAVLLSLLLLVLLVGVIGLLAWALAAVGVDDLPVDADVFSGLAGMFRGVFRWTRESWQGQSWHDGAAICTLGLCAPETPKLRRL